MSNELHINTEPSSIQRRYRRTSSILGTKDAESSDSRKDVLHEKSYTPNVNNYATKSVMKHDILPSNADKIDDKKCDDEDIVKIVVTPNKWFCMENYESNFGDVNLVTDDLMHNTKFDVAHKSNAWRRRSKRISLMNKHERNEDVVARKLESYKSELKYAERLFQNIKAKSKSKQISPTKQFNTGWEESDTMKTNRYEKVKENISQLTLNASQQKSSLPFIDKNTEMFNDNSPNVQITPRLNFAHCGETSNQLSNSSNIEKENDKNKIISFFPVDEVTKTMILRKDDRNENYSSGIDVNLIISATEDLHFNTSSNSDSLNTKEMFPRPNNRNKKIEKVEVLNEEWLRCSTNSRMRNFEYTNDSLLNEVDDFGLPENFLMNKRSSGDFISNQLINTGPSNKNIREECEKAINTNTQMTYSNNLFPALADCYRKSNYQMPIGRTGHFRIRESNHYTGSSSKMDIDYQLDSIHLSEPGNSKRRRLSNNFNPKKASMTPCDDSDFLEIPAIETDSILIEENDSSNKNSEKAPVRRSGRRKSIPVRWDGTNNMLPKNNSPNSDNIAAIEKYYLDKTVKKTTTSLETIFEETQENKSNLRNLMSIRKFKRSIIFSDKVAPGKIKKRQLKASKINHKMKLQIKSSLEDLHKKLKVIDQDDHKILD